MKSDLDALMQASQIDALVVIGAAQHNPPMFYFTGNAHITRAILVKKQGEEPVIFVGPMERDEAAASGLAVSNLMEYNYPAYLNQAEGNATRALAALYKDLLADKGVTAGRLAVYGEVDAGYSYGLYKTLQEFAPGLEIVGEVDSSVIAKAMTTKDEEEIARIRRMGQITVEVVGKAAEFLKSHKTKDEMLVKSDGQPLTIGEVKRNIDLWALERGVENPHGVIFALGRDGGVPHSAGTDEDVLRLGQSIVFDIYLREPGGGYHYDFTRTWCLGYAPEEVQAIYDDVLAVYQDLTEGLEANTPLAALQKRACELFEAQGHPTIASDRNTTDGYIHGIGHGLGLNIHEKPSYLDPEGLLSPGAVVTIEPGLYYPEKGMGCRLEDVYYVNPQGEVELLAEYPLDLVLEM